MQYFPWCFSLLNVMIECPLGFVYLRSLHGCILWEVTPRWHQEMGKAWLSITPKGPWRAGQIGSLEYKLSGQYYMRSATVTKIEPLWSCFNYWIYWWSRISWYSQGSPASCYCFMLWNVTHLCLFKLSVLFLVDIQWCYTAQHREECWISFGWYIRTPI